LVEITIRNKFILFSSEVEEKAGGNGEEEIFKGEEAIERCSP
jgi:hypothetical protein